MQVTIRRSERNELYELLKLFVVFLLMFLIVSLITAAYMFTLVLGGVLLTIFFYLRRKNSEPKPKLPPVATFTDDGLVLEDHQNGFDWSRVNRIAWPLNTREHPIRLYLEDPDGLAETLGIQIFLKQVHSADRGKLIYCLRRLANKQNLEQKNWPEFCLRAAVPRLDSKILKRQLADFPRLREHLSSKRLRKRQDEWLEEVPEYLWPFAFLCLISPLVLWGLAGAISFSALLNSYLITGALLNSIVWTCLGFSGVLFVLGSLGWLARQTFGGCEDPIGLGENESRGFPFALASLLVYLVVMPMVGWGCIQIGGEVGRILLLVAMYFPFFLMIGLVGMQAASQQSSDRNQIKKDAVRFWQKITSDSELGLAAFGKQS